MLKKPVPIPFTLVKAQEINLSAETTVLAKLMATEDSQKRCVDYVIPIPLQKGFHYWLSPYIYLFTCTLHSIFKMNLSILTSSPNRCCTREKHYSYRCVNSNPTNPSFCRGILTGNYTQRLHFFNAGGLGIKSTGTVQNYWSHAVNCFVILYHLRNCMGLQLQRRYLERACCGQQCINVFPMY